MNADIHGVALLGSPLGFDLDKHAGLFLGWLFVFGNDFRSNSLDLSLHGPFLVLGVEWSAFSINEQFAVLDAGITSSAEFNGNLVSLLAAVSFHFYTESVFVGILAVVLLGVGRQALTAFLILLQVHTFELVVDRLESFAGGVAEIDLLHLVLFLHHLQGVHLGARVLRVLLEHTGADDAEGQFLGSALVRLEVDMNVIFSGVHSLDELLQGGSLKRV